LYWRVWKRNFTCKDGNVRFRMVPWSDELDNNIYRIENRLFLIVASKQKWLADFYYRKTKRNIVKHIQKILWKITISFDQIQISRVPLWIRRVTYARRVTWSYAYRPFGIHSNGCTVYTIQYFTHSIQCTLIVEFFTVYIFIPVHSTVRYTKVPFPVYTVNCTL